MITSRRFAMTAALVLSVAVLPACSGDDSPSDTPESSTGALGGTPAGEGEACPSELPRPDEPGNGLGTLEPAASAPSLAAFEAASVCLYDASKSEESTDSETPTYTWRLASSPVEVGKKDLKALNEQLGELVPEKAGRTCSPKVSTRWLLISTGDDEATGVVVDDFGCRAVRLTDAPFETAPGEATREGVVPGVLAGSNDLLNQIKLVWING